MLPFLADC